MQLSPITMKITNPLSFTAALSAAVLLSSCAASVRNPASTASLQKGSEKVSKIALTMTGSSESRGSKDWEHFKAEWKTAMASSTSSAGLGYSYHETEPKTGAGQTTSVVVSVKDYRYVSPAARYGFGVMTGNAYVDATASFRDLKSGKSLGTKSYSTTSTAWQGVFSAMTDKQVKAICDQIVEDVKGK